MKVSVVICTHSPDRFDDFVDAVESLQQQSYDPVEIVLVIDGDRSVYSNAWDVFGDVDNITIHCNDENRGVSASRTRGAELASGDIVAFMDDDAVSEPDWVETIVETYVTHDAIAVGGRMVGEWLAGRPWYLPEEFDWLVGVTHRGFADPYEEVRNTFESNISFQREKFLELNGFNPELGPTAENYSHSEGAELGARLHANFGRGVIYAPDAVVRHKVFEERTRFMWLCRRAFEQGASKLEMKKRINSQSEEEVGFLVDLLTVHTIRRIRELVSEPSLDSAGQLLALYLFTGLVAAGYLSALISRSVL